MGYQPDDGRTLAGYLPDTDGIPVGRLPDSPVDVHRTRTGRLGGRIVPAEWTRPDRGICPAARRQLNRSPKGRKLPNYGKSPASPSGEAGLCCVQQEWGGRDLAEKCERSVKAAKVHTLFIMIWYIMSHNLADGRREEGLYEKIPAEGLPAGADHGPVCGDIRRAAGYRGHGSGYGAAAGLCWRCWWCWDYMC